MIFGSYIDIVQVLIQANFLPLLTNSNHSIVERLAILSPGLPHQNSHKYDPNKTIRSAIQYVKIFILKKKRNQEKKIDQSINVNILIIERKYAAFHRVKIKWDLFSYPVWLYSNSIFLPIRTNVSGRRRAVNEILLVLKPTGNKGGFLFFFLLINSNIFLAAIVSTYPTNFFSCRCS